MNASPEFVGIALVDTFQAREDPHVEYFLNVFQVLSRNELSPEVGSSKIIYTISYIYKNKQDTKQQGKLNHKFDFGWVFLYS